MKHIIFVLVAATLLSACSNIPKQQAAVQERAPHYRTWKEKLDAENPARQRTFDLVLRDMMQPAQMPMIDPVRR